MILIKPKYRTYEETEDVMEVENYKKGDQDVMKLLIDAIRVCSPRPWWKRINWKWWRKV